MTGARSYDPIRCQEPQLPRRPLAIGRRGRLLNPSRSAPGMSSTPSAQSHIRGYRSGGRNPLLRRGSPSLTSRMRRCRAHSENGGVPEGCPARRDGGYVYSPASPGTSCRGPTAISRARRRWRRSPSPGACPSRASPRVAGAGARTPSSRASSPRGGRRSPWASASAGGRGVAPGPLDRQLPDERVAGPADPAEAHGVRARPLLRGEAKYPSPACRSGTSRSRRPRTRRRRRARTRTP